MGCVVFMVQHGKSVLNHNISSKAQTQLDCHMFECTNSLNIEKIMFAYKCVYCVCVTLGVFSYTEAILFKPVVNRSVAHYI